MSDDIELLRKYAESGSGEAFAAVVSRHVSLVYSAALRQVGDAHLAEEVTQTVFIILSRKAGSLSPKTVVSGWLCKTARHVSARALTMRRRRQEREHEAFMQSSLNESGPAEAWMQIAPHLDKAMAELGQKDHDALVIRFFQGRTFRDVSAALGTTEAAAKMRVNRALDKLRALFRKRGIALSATMIAGAVSAHSVQAAPAGLAASATLAAVNGAAVTTSTLTLIESTLKFMAWTKAKTAALAGAVALLAAGTTTLVNGGPDKAVVVRANIAPDYSSPEATLKTMINALAAADTEKFAAGCTPERAARFRSQNALKSKEELDREAAGMAQAFSKFEILERKTISPTEVHLHVNALGKSKDALHGDRNVVMRMIKIGPDWKYDGEQR